MKPPRSIPWAWVTALPLLVLAGCDNMQHQENVRAFEPSPYFADGSSARTPPEHTVPRTATGPEDPLTTGMQSGSWLQLFPMTLAREFIVRGGERYAIFCADCHGADGSGHGIVVERGFPKPTSLHDGRIRQEPVGELFAAIGKGRGVMYGFADRIGPRDRWAIVAYIRALQKTRDARLSDVPEPERKRLSTP